MSIFDDDDEDDGSALFPRYRPEEFALVGECPPDLVMDERRRIERKVRAGKESECGTCTQLVKVYPRWIYHSPALWLMWLTKEHLRTGTWVHVSRSKVRGGDYAKLKYWRLIKQKSNEDPEKGSSGLWKPDKLGIQFAQNLISLPMPAYVFSRKLYGFGNEMRKIEDCLDDKFDYRKLWESL